MNYFLWITSLLVAVAHCDVTTPVYTEEVTSNSTNSNTTVPDSNTTITATPSTSPSPTPVSTPPSTTPSVTTPATPSLHPFVNVTYYNDNNTACVSLQGEFLISVLYNNNVTGYLPVPADVILTGDCSYNDTTQYINLRFNNTWELEFVFSEDADENIVISEISVTYDTSVFGATQPGSGTVRMRGELFRSEVGTFFKCGANSTLVQESDVTLTSTRLKYQAFVQSEEELFTGEFEQCKADEDDGDLKLYMGLVLGGLILATFACLMLHHARYRGKRSQYEFI